MERYYSTQPRQQRQSRGSTRMYLTLQDKVEVMAQCGDSAMILYEYYVSKGGKDNYSFSDELVAKALHWKIRKVKTYRLKLVANNYFKQMSGRFSSGKKFTVTYLDPVEIRELNGLGEDILHEDKL